jgi:rod shape-determining protein MreC
LTARTLAWTGFLAIAAFVLMVASRLTALDPVENLTLSMTSPIQNVLHDTTQPVANWVNDLTDANGLSAENARLRAENERLTNDLARAREDATQLQTQQDVDAIKQQFPDDSFLGAGVVARDSSNTRRIVAIDRGSADGVKEGMIVVTEGRSLVGTVTKTFGDYAWVRLITDPKSAVSAMVQESRADGVVAGDYGGSLDMEFVGQGAIVKNGDFVITSGIGGGYPAGIVIGRVSGVERAEQDLFQKVHVDHLASLDKLEQVLVLTSFEPKTLATP